MKFSVTNSETNIEIMLVIEESSFISKHGCFYTTNNNDYGNTLFILELQKNMEHFQ
jgi:hypothetical protein